MSQDFSPSSEHFHSVIALHETKGVSWDELSKKVPLLPRGWFELAQLPLEDRIEFSQEYWFVKVPLFASNGERIEQALEHFFAKVEEIGIFATQEKEGMAYEPHLVYSLKENQGYFHGYPPASEQEVANLEKQFGTVRFPPDYLAFLQIHDGFSKLTDTGLIRSREMAKMYLKFQQLLSQDVVFAADGQIVNPASLIPFYESYGLHCYQCFFADWYPDEEMGNIYFSQNEKTLSNFMQSSHLQDNIAFPTFLDWLIFYLQESSP